ncbi:MAG: hypothetical protein JF603_13105, partial [Acidobacteria bacterium]|nr:hypothetical protein [Acidobacteriota bacterium]
LTGLLDREAEGQPSVDGPIGMRQRCQVRQLLDKVKRVLRISRSYVMQEALPLLSHIDGGGGGSAVGIGNPCIHGLCLP